MFYYINLFMTMFVLLMLLMLQNGRWCFAQSAIRHFCHLSLPRGTHFHVELDLDYKYKLAHPRK